MMSAAELLKPLEIGDAVRQDCRIVEVCGDWPTLKQMEGSQANLDELDYLAKRLDSFDVYEKTQFQSMAFRLDLHSVCLYKCGNERYNLVVHAPVHKEKLFGKAGGR